MKNEIQEMIINSAIEADNRLNEITPEDSCELMEIYADEYGTTFKNFSHATSDELIEHDDYSGEVKEY